MTAFAARDKHFMLPLFLLTDVDVTQKQECPINFNSLSTSELLSQLCPTEVSSKLNKTARTEKGSPVCNMYGIKPDSKSLCGDVLADVSCLEVKNQSLMHQKSNVTVDSKHLSTFNVCDRSIDQETSDGKQLSEHENHLDCHRLFPVHSCDPCAGLKEFIRRKDRKEFLCSRCGWTHSNCVRTGNTMGRGSANRKSRLNRSQSWLPNSPRRVIVICPNCGKRSHSPADGDRPRAFENFRSMSWPLPLERIVEDTSEEHGHIERWNCKRGVREDLIRSLPFCKSACDEVQANSSDAGDIELCMDELRRIFTEDRPLRKILIANSNSSVRFIKSLRNLTAELFGDPNHVLFVAVVTEDDVRSSPDWLNSSDKYVVIKQSADDDKKNDMKVVQVAKENHVDGVWMGLNNRREHMSKELAQSGIIIMPTSVICAAQPEKCKVRLSESAPKDTNLNAVPPTVAQNLSVVEKHDEVVPDEQPCQTSSTLNRDVLISSATLLAHCCYERQVKLYKDALERKEVLPITSLSSRSEMRLIHQNSNYRVRVTRTSSSQYSIRVNGTITAVDVCRLVNDNLILTLDGASVSTQLEGDDERSLLAAGNGIYELKRRNKSIDISEFEIIEKPERNGFSHNRSQLPALLQDCMTIKNKHQTSDFASKQTGKRNSTKLFPCVLESLLLVMNGSSSYPDDLFESKMQQEVQQLMSSLNDPTLPLVEMQEVLTSMRGRLPPDTDRRIRREMSRYASNITSMMALFPAVKMQQIIDKHSACFKHQVDRDVFIATCKPLLDVAHRYRNGIRGHMEHVLINLLQEYLRVEEEFQDGSFQDCVSRLLSTKDVDETMKIILSHAAVKHKSSLALRLMNCLTGHDHHLSNGVRNLLNSLSRLTSEETAKVALNAKRVLRRARKDPYELRYNQIKSIFLSSCESDLMNVISDADTYDVLPHFFCHDNPDVRMAALEIYVRRSNSCSSINTIHHHHVDTNYPAIIFTHDPQLNSISSCSGSDCYRNLAVNECNNISSFNLVAMTAFPDLLSFEECIPQVVELLSTPFSVRDFTVETSFMAQQNSSCTDDLFESQVASCIYSNSLNVAIVTHDGTNDDETLSQELRDVLNRHKTRLLERNLQRITFLLHKCNAALKFFTYAIVDEQIAEVYLLRHIEPGLAHLYQLNRMQNFHLQLLPSSSPHLHFYVGSNQEEEFNKIFMRSVINSNDSSDHVIIELFESEIELTLLEVLDHFHLESNYNDMRKNIFIHFQPKLSADQEEVKDLLLSIVLRHGKRLWNRGVVEIEVSYRILSNDLDEGTAHQSFVVLSNESDCSVID